jgi:hypothetical protein
MQLTSSYSLSTRISPAVAALWYALWHTSVTIFRLQFQEVSQFAFCSDNYIIFLVAFYLTMNVGPCHHGMARRQVANGGTASYMEGSCK